MMLLAFAVLGLVAGWDGSSSSVGAKKDAGRQFNQFGGGFNNGGGFNQGGFNQGGFNQGGFNQGGFNNFNQGFQQQRPQCFSHNQCAQQFNQPFCYRDVGCTHCGECQHCHDGIDGTCGPFCNSQPTHDPPGTVCGRFGGNQGQQNNGFGNQGQQNNGFGNQGQQNNGFGNQGQQNNGFGNQGQQNNGFGNQGQQNNGFNNQGQQNNGFNNQGQQGQQNGFNNQGQQGAPRQTGQTTSAPRQPGSFTPRQPGSFTPRTFAPRQPVSTGTPQLPPLPTQASRKEAAQPVRDVGPSMTEIAKYAAWPAVFVCTTVLFSVAMFVRKRKATTVATDDEPLLP